MTRRPATAKVLIASDNADDAAQIVRQLKATFANTTATTDIEHVARDFEECRPDVLVLAFGTIEKSQRYCLSLYRQSQVSDSHRHRIVLLCTKDELRAAFDLCVNAVFDDYVLYWPMSQDGLRLTMSVWKAAGEVQALECRPDVKELSAHVEQLTAMEALLETQLSEGGRRTASAARTLQEAESAVSTAIDGIARQAVVPRKDGTASPNDAARLSAEIAKLTRESVAKAFKATNDALAPVTAWPRDLQKQLDPHLSGMRGFAEKIGKEHRTVMVVEDDEYARKLIGHALKGRGYELLFAQDGATALGALRRTRPHLILMDINLPDIDGVALMRLVKGNANLTGIPVLVLTGDARRTTIESSMKAGAAGFIVKPFAREALIAKIERALNATPEAP